MKVAICSVGTDLNSQVSPVFGRCPYFLIVESESAEFSVISNSALASQRGAGVRAAQTVVAEGVKSIICGNFGPNAFSLLKTSGITLYLGVGLRAKDALDKYKKGELKEVEMPVASAGFGFGRGKGRGRGFGRGSGRGFARRR